MMRVARVLSLLGSASAVTTLHVSRSSSGPAPAPATAEATVVMVAPAPAKKEAAAPMGLLPQPGSQVVYNTVEENREDSLSEIAFDAAEPGFDDLDCLKKDGTITVDEAATYGVKNGVPWSEIKPLFEIVDEDHDNKISHKEFDAAQPVSDGIIQDLRAGFTDLDLNRDGMLSEKEWMAYCDGWMHAPNITEGTCMSMFESADHEDPKGLIDREEFNSAGERCKTIDDGACSLLALGHSSGKRFLEPSAKNAAKTPASRPKMHLTVAQMLSALRFRYQRRHLYPAQPVRH